MRRELAPEPRMEWKKAWVALRGLIADPQRTDLVFEITQALSSRGFGRAYRRFASSAPGRLLLRDRPDLLAALRDHAALGTLPAGSLGRAYLDFMRCNDLTAEGLIEADAAAAARAAPVEKDPDRHYFGSRMRDAHDLWHTLTGYGMDEAGEAANLAFTYAQLPNLGIGLIVAAAAVIGPKDWRLSWQRYLFRAWRRGRKAVDMTLVPYEKLLPRSLEEVRRELHIQPASEAHPQGVIVSSQPSPLALPLAR